MTCNAEPAAAIERYPAEQLPSIAKTARSPPETTWTAEQAAVNR